MKVQFLGFRTLVLLRSRSSLEPGGRAVAKVGGSKPLSDEGVGEP